MGVPPQHKAVRGEVVVKLYCWNQGADGSENGEECDLGANFQTVV